MVSRKKPIFKTAFGTYKARSVIGQGGSGRVFRCVDADGEPWAIKLLDSGRASAERVKRFKNEHEFCRRNQHDNVITVVDHGIYADRVPFFVMPCYDGSLRTLMKQSIPHNAVLTWYAQILDGVEAAHLKGVVHRDLKPENILWSRADERLVVADFGIAHFMPDEIYTFINTAPMTRLANFQYSAPEQRQRGQEVDGRADIYALGLILNEMFTGSIPQGADYDTIEGVAPAFSYLDAVVAEMIQHKPSNRPGEIRAVKNQLIARENAFIENQKLDTLKQAVVPESELSDPLIDNPPQLVDSHWDGVLHLKLSRTPNDLWRGVLRNLIGKYPPGKGPRDFQVINDYAHIKCEPDEARRLLGSFREWLPAVNEKYAERVKRKAQLARSEERKKLREEREAAELQARVNRELRS